MKAVSFYHRETGLLNAKSILVSDDSAVAINCPDDHVAIEGHFDHLSQRVDTTTGQVIDYRPDAPNASHEWNADAKRWMLSAEAASREEMKASALAKIAHLEANVQPRAVREAQLSRPGSMKRLQDIDDEIEALRKALTE